MLEDATKQPERASPGRSSSAGAVEGRRARIVLAEDDARMLDAITDLLHDRFEIVGRVSDGEALLQEVERQRPDVAVVDLSMPVLNGIEATRRIVASNPGVKVIILTVHEDSAYVEAAFQAGARGYVLKFEASSELIPAIAAVTGNGFYRSRRLREGAS